MQLQNKKRYRSFRIGGGGDVHVFRCQQPNEVLKKKKFTVLYRVPNLNKKKKKTTNKEEVGVFWIKTEVSFIFRPLMCSVAWCPFLNIPKNSILLPAGGVLTVGAPGPADRWRRRRRILTSKPFTN